MLIKEIICEDAISNLIPTLMLLQKQASLSGEPSNLTTDSLVQLVQNTGRHDFTIDSLQSAYESDDAVKGLLNNFPNIKDELDSGGMGDEDNMDDMGAGEEQTPAIDPTDPDSQYDDPDAPILPIAPEKRVSSMAQRAANKRS
jgi:hypothetical protein